MESIISIENLKNIVGQTNSIIDLLGYYSVNDGGGGLFYYDENSLEVPDNGIIIKPNNVNQGRWIRKLENKIDIKCFGAKGDNSSDDTQFLQKAIDVCYSLNKILIISTGTYLHTGIMLQKSNIVSQTIILEGNGMWVSILKYTGTASGIIVSGGSGPISGDYFKDIGLEGTENSAALEIAGRGGFTTYNMRFGINAIGVLFHNRYEGEFTEFSVMDNPLFDIQCKRYIEYRVGTRPEDGSRLGNNSFHGSGIRAGKANLDVNNNIPILINQYAFPYNSPLSMQIWCYGTAKTLIQNNGLEQSNFYGNLTFELFNTPSSPENADILCAGNPLFYLGTIQGLTWLQKGTLIQTSFLNLTGPGTGNIVRYNKPNITKNIKMLGTGNRTAIFVGDYDESLLLRLTANADNYVARYLLLLTNNGFGNNGYAQIISTIQFYNGIGWQEPDFSINEAGEFIVGSPSWTSEVNVILNGINISKTFY